MEAHDAFGQNAFSGTALPNDLVDAAFVELGVDVGKHLDLPEPLAEMLDLDHINSICVRA